jgi:lipopolysaccharide heptosyltransferase II
MIAFQTPVTRSKSLVSHFLRWLMSPQATRLIGEPLFWLMGRRRNGSEIVLSQVKRVLVVRLDEIGDVVMTTPLLRELRRNLPDAWIALVVQPAAHNLVATCPYVNQVLTFDWRVEGRLANLRSHGRALRLARRRLWRSRFDLGILPRWDADHCHGTFLLYVSGARWRMGYSERDNARKKRLNAGFDRLLTHALEDATLKHEVERNLHVLRALGGKVRDDPLELWLDEEDEAFAREVLEHHDVGLAELIVGFGPSGGHSPLKQWPPARFAELGRWLQAKYGARIMVFGGPGEEPLGREIGQGLDFPPIDMVGRTTLRQSAALLSRCHVFIANDTGLMHVAAATGIPVVALFGSSCPHRFSPWGKDGTVLWSRLPCSPCFQEGHAYCCRTCVFDQPRCMVDLAVEQVESAVERYLPRREIASLGVETVGG